ncbi:hypothetical protein [Paenibacillus daejeonensis]|uniref:hypothetical protein n=1 Tax=Paenibacillus daejeonensis TaxID=135193 RepID=UPI0003666B53|nr:hypothetical protein [Paenibacillus daejeonensis]
MMSNRKAGIIFMTLFGTMWAYTGLFGIQGPWPSIMLFMPLIVGAGLLVGGIFMNKNTLLSTDEGQEVSLTDKKEMKRRFNLVFAAQGLAIAITIAICIATQTNEFIPLIIALVVGLHFFPLASIFKMKLYYWTGSLLCLLAAITWLFVPASFPLGEYTITSTMTVIGFGSAFILWGSAVSIWKV